MSVSVEIGQKIRIIRCRKNILAGVRCKDGWIHISSEPQHIGKIFTISFLRGGGLVEVDQNNPLGGMPPCCYTTNLNLFMYYYNK